jgi:hypothetical protein
MTQQIMLEPTLRFVDRAITSATSGETRDYLVSAAGAHLRVNERTLRNGFAELREQASESNANELGYQSMRDLNAFYKTRYPLSKLRDVADIAFQAVHETGWWNSEPPALFACLESDVESMSMFMPSVLKRVSEAGLHSPHSLVTKWMHFCFPNSFVICDAQAVASIQTWSYFTYPLVDTAAQRFAAAQTGRVDGLGYKGILDFYRFCCLNSSKEQLDSLQLAADHISSEIAAPVSAIDLIDKLLWLSNGDPRKLGLL